MMQNPETKYMNPYLAGIFLGVVLFLSFLLFGHGLGASGGLAKIVGREDIQGTDTVRSDRAEVSPEMSVAGHAMGTPGYMPPEQANGELDKIDHRSDIYALGAILYEILTLTKPIQATTPLAVSSNPGWVMCENPNMSSPARWVKNRKKSTVRSTFI